MKEIYINKLKLINNDLKMSLKKTKEDIMKSDIEKNTEGLYEEGLMEVHPKRVISEIINDSKMHMESPLIKKEIIRKRNSDVKKSSHGYRAQIKMKNNSKMRKSDVIKKKQSELPLLKGRTKKSGKESRRKDKGTGRQKTSERKNISSKTLQKKHGNNKQYGRNNQKKSGGGYTSKKNQKGTQNPPKYSNKSSTYDKPSLRKKTDDDEKNPNRPTHKLEKGHYTKDHPSTVKTKKWENEKSKVKIKRSGNGLALKKKSFNPKTSNPKRKINFNNSENTNRVKVDKDGGEEFEPQRALRKKVVKKKNFSLNLDTFKNKITKDYHTHVDKFVASIENNKVPKKGNKKFQTEKHVNKASNKKNNSDSEEEDFNYERGDALEMDNEPEMKIKNPTNKSSKTGTRKQGSYGSKAKSNVSRSYNDASRRKKSKSKFGANSNRMSMNFKNNLKNNDRDRKETSSKKMNYSSKGKSKNTRNSSIKDFTRKKKGNLSISMNKRYGTSGMRKKSTDNGVIRKKNQSINPGGRFMGMEKIQRKRAVSETRSVSNISFTDIEKAGLRKTKNIVEYIKKRDHLLPPFTKARSVVKDFGIIKGFIVNTHKGTVRAGNEDRVSILLNAQHKFRKSQKKMTNCAMFSVFDGHGGTDCCNFLKENLHNKILADLDIHGDFDESMKKIYTEVDQTYLKRAIKKKQNYSGSCANCLFVLDDEVVVVNSGDSRTICSKNGGKEIEAMSIDHKPGYFSEFSRVIKNGGQLYRVSSNLKTIENMFYTVTNYSDVLQIDEIEKTNKNLCFGPWRIKPGGLSVSR